MSLYIHGASLHRCICLLYFRAMLELGKSQSWTRALEQVSGVTRMDSKPLLEYFSDLHTWLQEENRKNNRFPGWNAAADPCKNMKINREHFLSFLD